MDKVADKVIKTEILSNFVYEIVERAIRFISHLDDIESQFYSDSEDKKSLMDNYKRVLQMLLDKTFETYREFSNPEDTNKSQFFSIN